jgi:uncharacterized protein (TIGR02147 family)
LNKVFIRIKKQNPLLSLRGLAKKVDVTPSYLSKIFLAKKNLPLHLVPVIAEVLQMDITETNDLQNLVVEELEFQKSGGKTGLKSQRRSHVNFQNYEDLGKSDFSLLERWYYLPILNYLTLSKAEKTAPAIGKRLKLSPTDVESALRYLKSLGYVEVGSQGEVRSTKLKARFPTAKSQQKIRDYHLIMMKKAEGVLNSKTEQTDFEKRLISGICFSGDSQKVKEAQVILNEALFRVAELMAESDSDEVFQLQLQFFPVSDN